jgi:DNA-binding NtrC family response regulator
MSKASIMESNQTILLASAELESRRALGTILSQEGCDTVCASHLEDCREILNNRKIDLVFCDRRLADGTYRDLLRIARSAKQRVRVVVTSRLADWDEYLEALHHGAFDLIAAPCQPTDVLWALSQARREERERSAFLSPMETQETPVQPAATATPTEQLLPQVQAAAAAHAASKSN